MYSTAESHQGCGSHDRWCSTRGASLNWLHRCSIWLLASLPAAVCPPPFCPVLIWIDAIRLVETEVALHFWISGFGNRCSIFLFSFFLTILKLICFRIGASLYWLHRSSIWLFASLPAAVCPFPFRPVLIWIDAIRLVETEVALHFWISGFGNRCSIFFFSFLLGILELICFRITAYLKFMRCVR